MIDQLIAELSCGPARDDIELARDAMDNAVIYLTAKSAECQRLREALQGIVSAQALFFDHPDRRISLERARAALQEAQP